MAEWLKAHAWKVCVLLKVPRVRIPVSPPNNIIEKTICTDMIIDIIKRYIKLDLR